MALKEILAKFGFEVDSKNLKKAEKDTDSFAKKVVTAFAASEIIGAIRGFVTETIAAGDAITDTSAALGVSRTALQQWTYAAGQVGLSGEDVSNSFKFLQKNAVDGAAAFKKIGVDVKDASGNIAPVEDLMYGVAAGLASVENPAERTKLALEILGKGGAKMNALFAGGVEGIDALMARFKELGGGFSEEALDAMDGAGDAIADVELASKSLKGSLMLVLAPAIRGAANWIAKLTAFFSKGDAAAARFKSALVVLGTAGAAAGMAMLKPYLPFLLTLAAAYLIVQDFWTFLQGGDSATGRFLNWLFGDGSADEIRADIKGVWDDVKGFKKELEQRPGGGGIWDWIEEGLSRAGANLTKFFYDELPEAADYAGKAVLESGGSFEDWAILVSNALNPASYLKQLDTGITGVRDFGTKLVESVKGWWEDVKTAANELGANIIKGITDGLLGEVPEMSSKGAEAIDKLIKSMAGPKGADARSPSRKSMVVGDRIAQGPLVALAARLDDMRNMGARYAMAGIPTTSNVRNVNVQMQNHNSVMVQGASSPRATGSAVSGAMTGFGFDEKNRLMQVLGN